MYTDPSFGPMIIQFLVAGLAAIGMYFAIFRNKFTSLFSKKKTKNEEVSQADNKTDREG